jgi:hypothetical protein
MGTGAATLQRAGAPAGHREQMLASYMLILSGKRLVLGRLQARAVAGDLVAARRRPEMEDQVGEMRRQRDHWSLEGPAEDPELWVTAYSQLLTDYEQLLDHLEAGVEEAEPESRAELMEVDIPMVNGIVARQRRRLRFWISKASRD